MGTLGNDEAMGCFLERIKSKLLGLHHFQSREVLPAEAEAIYEIITWHGAEVEDFGGDFQGFYDGLLLYSNLKRFSDQGGEKAIGELIDVLFEIHGSDPQHFPAAVKSGLSLLSRFLGAPTLTAKDENGLLAVTLEACNLGLPEAHMLWLHLNHHWTALQRKYPSYGYGDLERGITPRGLPFARGFRLWSYRCLLDFWQNRSYQYQPQEKPAKMTTDQETYAKSTPEPIRNPYFQIFVGPSGCGKTTSIQSLLQQNWGLYLFPANFPETMNQATGLRESERQSRLEYRPRRGGGSRDTQTWLNDVKSMCEYCPKFGDAAHSLAQILLQVRIWVLEDYRGNVTHYTAADWLNLQVSCDDPEDDVFNHLYRVARFSEPPNTGTKNSRESELIICFDEAQCDLPLISTDGITWPHLRYPRTSLRPLSYMLVASFWLMETLKSLNDGAKGVKIHLSGTALRLNDMRQLVEDESSHIGSLSQLTRSDLEPALNSGFQLVETDKDFQNILARRGCRLNDELVDEIVEHSKPLRGRIVWSVYYIDQIQELMAGGSVVRGGDIKHVSRKTCKRAKDGLKQRLEDMEARPFTSAMNRDTNVWKEEEILRDYRKADDDEVLRNFRTQQTRLHELLDELCWLAVRSDLLGEASIFKSAESTELVARGFAFLEDQEEPTGLKVRLKERLAVEAALEHFQTKRLSNGQSLYDRALINFLYLEQNNASALGKTAEFFFAWHLRKVLRKPGLHKDPILPTFEPDERRKVLERLIGESQSIEHLKQKKKNSNPASRFVDDAGCNNLNEFHIIEGKDTAYQEEVSENRDINMWGWLRDIRKGKSGDSLRATFWFPSNNTGPDALFVLTRQPSGAGKKRKGDPNLAHALDYSLVLCAVQIKRQEKVKEPAVAIQTTDPNYWFTMNNKKDTAGIRGELANWRKRGYPIVRILVTALTDPKEYQEPAGQASKTTENTFSSKAARTKQGPQRTRQKSTETDQDISESDQGTPEDWIEQGRDLQEVPFPPHLQYYTSVGAADDHLLFGDAFRKLRQAQGIQTPKERRLEARAK